MYDKLTVTAVSVSMTGSIYRGIHGSSNLTLRYSSQTFLYIHSYVYIYVACILNTAGVENRVYTALFLLILDIQQLASSHELHVKHSKRFDLYGGLWQAK